MSFATESTTVRRAPLCAAILLLSAGLLAASVAHAQKSGAHANAAPHWTYSGESGPQHWGAVAAQFATCAGGKNQSPIDIESMVEADLGPIIFHYKAGAARHVINNGHTIQANFPAGNSIAIDGVLFELKQVHFHAPSENHVAGRSFPMEGHLVHADANGNLAVLAVLYELGANNAAIDQLWSNMPSEAGASAALAAPVPARSLLPSERDYYRYTGSLTTPPCSEGVRWLVMKQFVAVSSEQVKKFAGVLREANNRPIQASNARVVLK
jgi:carbonic anhydrase